MEAEGMCNICANTVSMLECSAGMRKGCCTSMNGLSAHCPRQLHKMMTRGRVRDRKRPLHSPFSLELLGTKCWRRKDDSRCHVVPAHTTKINVAGIDVRIKRATSVKIPCDIEIIYHRRGIDRVPSRTGQGRKIRVRIDSGEVVCIDIMIKRAKVDKRPCCVYCWPGINVGSIGLKAIAHIPPISRHIADVARI